MAFYRVPNGSGSGRLTDGKATYQTSQGQGEAEGPGSKVEGFGKEEPGGQREKREIKCHLLVA